MCVSRFFKCTNRWLHASKYNIILNTQQENETRENFLSIAEEGKQNFNINVERHGKCDYSKAGCSHIFMLII